MGLTIGKRINMKKLTIALLLFTPSALTSKGVTRTKELVQGRKRSEMLTTNTIKKSDLYVRDYKEVSQVTRSIKRFLSKPRDSEVEEKIQSELPSRQ